MFRKSDTVIAAGLGLAALGLYWITLAPTVLEADPGEFQFVPWLPGIAHPTGYPLYILLGWLWTHAFPIGEVAWRMNLFSALLAAAAVAMLYAAARHMLHTEAAHTPPASQRIAAAVTAIIFAVTPTFWSQAIIAEVYALHALFVILLLWLALTFKAARFQPNSWPGWALALVFGLSLTHHRTTVLLLPALGLFWWKNVIHSPAKSAPPLKNYFSRRVILTYILLLLTPLLLYLYLPLIAAATPYSVIALSENQQLVLYENSLLGFWDHSMGTVFSSDLQPTAAGLDRLLLAGDLFKQEVGWPGIILSLGGLMALWQQRRFDMLWLTGAAFVAFTAFNLAYFIGDIFVLFIPVWLIASLWLGAGFLAISTWTAKQLVKAKIGYSPLPVFNGINQKVSSLVYQVIPIIFAALAGVILLITIAARLPEISQKENITARTRWTQILTEPIAANAILVSNDRNEIMPLWYFQFVQGLRPDLLGLFPLIVTDPAYANVGRVLDQALMSGRSVYLTKPMPGLSLKADFEPADSLTRAFPITPSPATIINQTLPEITLNADHTETVKLLGLDVSPRRAAPGESVTVTLYWQPVRPLSIDYTSYVHLTDSAGNGLAQSDQRPGGVYYPSHYWQVDEILRDRHMLTLPADASPGEYQWRVGMYYQPEPGQFKGMGNGLQIEKVNLRITNEFVNMDHWLIEP